MLGRQEIRAKYDAWLLGVKAAINKPAQTYVVPQANIITQPQAAIALASRGRAAKAKTCMDPQAAILPSRNRAAKTKAISAIKKSFDVIE